MKKISYCIVCHTEILKNNIDNAGPAHSIVFYLENKANPYLFIRHSIYAEGITFVTYFDGANKKEEIIRYGKSFGEMGARFQEGLITFKLIYKYFKKSSLVYIGVDPLNALWGLIQKKINKVKIFIVFNPDYTKKRYGNLLLNKFYYFLDSLTSHRADMLLAVSMRILDVRKNDGIEAEKLFWLPNSPAISRTKKLVLKNGNPLNLIVVSARKSVDEFFMLLDTMELLVKDFPEIKLTFVCLPLMEKKLKVIVKKRELQRSIRFAGSMSHDNLFRVIAKHGVGLAFYVNSYSGEYYMDSMKARDYLALGLPVIISGDNGTADDIVKNNAGVHINANEAELAAAIRKIIQNKKLYSKLRANALELASKRDNEKILNEVFKKINTEYNNNV